MNCPLCIDQTLEAMHRQGVEIDVCPKCRGIWLDRGELDRLAADPDTESRRDRDRSDDLDRDDDRDDDRERSRDRSKKRRKKKSLAYRIGDALEDVLDF